MGQSAVKNPKKIFSQAGADPLLNNRVTNLENNEYKILYFETISSATGTITKPTGATILLDQFYSGGDALVETLSNGQPTGQSPLTIGGAVVSVTSFDISGNYVLSGTPSAYPVALVYIFKIKAIYLPNLNMTNIMQMDANGYVPYTGAITNVDLGEYQIKVGQIELDQSPTGTAGVAITLNCETDFVGKNESFVKLATDLANQALNYATKEELLASDFNGITVAEKLIEQTGVIGEKIEVGSFDRLEGAFVGSYIHAGKIATLVALSANVEGADEAAKNVAMQAAAMNPIALNEAGVDAAIIEKEIEIAKEQLRAEGKPEAMLDNISKGKIQRFYKDNTLVNQDYIKDGSMSVAAYIKSVEANLTVSGFKRVALG